MGPELTTWGAEMGCADETGCGGAMGAAGRVISEEFEILGVGPHVKMRWGPS